MSVGVGTTPEKILESNFENNSFCSLVHVLNILYMCASFVWRQVAITCDLIAICSVGDRSGARLVGKILRCFLF